MAPEMLKIAPKQEKASSEPNTPIYATSTGPEEAPVGWFDYVTHKEKLAILTIEHIPGYLRDAARDHTVTTTDDCISPRLAPLIERMKFHFSRAIALARHEAINGSFDWNGVPGEPHRPEDPILPMDVMGSIEVEMFLAGVEEVRMPDDSNRVVFRRYWRILGAPAGFETFQGGVISAGSKKEHLLRKGVHKNMQEHWDETPKILLAEFSVDADGMPTAGRMPKCQWMF